MTLVVILNIVLAIAVIGGIVRLLSWTIVSSRADNLALTSRSRHPVPNPYLRRPRNAHRSLAPVTG
jgi:hypothetical protein